ncbi:TM0106 family RecB-like putative nuclease [Leekyejoonella antrihumi]|uniref:TM0106 family RecB-like putative nuclease n=1 Tax=Leekyejoonella antrihumi TaxID=1660198 RepID=A0A563DYK9_9MICO|nr:TM0106 family RecB-like putative nuclease [Leekyejoonella antrihumi]TWP35219.1 TM0106 family RecB-like putative nuclease [Leekyejoonella antrihumi]
MQRVNERLVLSPTDLTKHVACPHITTLDLAALEGGPSGPKPRATDDALRMVFAKGLTHERDYLAMLREQGRTVVEITERGREAAEAQTLEAMRAGADVIYQATFYDGDWIGHADFLLRKDGPSKLGDWCYDIADTKLARRLKVPALLQMAMYARRLTQLQGVAPRQLVIVTGDKQQHAWRLVDVASYARRVRTQLEQSIKDQAPTEPEPVAYCAQCRWQQVCTDQWLAQDDLVQVAGLRNDQRAALRATGIASMAALAEAVPGTLGGALSSATQDRLIQQARLQVAERTSGAAAYELLPAAPGKGLLMLPAPNDGDVYLDFEGDPWANDGAGREYLAGLWDRQGDFTSWWAHDFDAEGRLVADLLDDLLRRWRADPGMHVYHYAPYEVSALKRMTGRHATRETELDQLLRAEVFVDLYAVVRQGIRVSKPSYSIKKLEDFYWQRVRSGGDGDVADALTSVVEYERWLVEQNQSILDDIESYNRDDVRSTHDLHKWLEERREELGARGVELTRPLPPEPHEVKADELAEAELAGRLAEAGSELLAGCVGWHRREARPGWWAFFRYGQMSDQEIVDDGVAVGQIGVPTLVGPELSRTGKATSNRWRYTFPPQEGRPTETVHDVDTNAAVGKVLGCDLGEGWIDLKLGKSRTPLPTRGFGPSGPIADQVLRASIARCAELVLRGEQPMGARLLNRSVPPVEKLRPRPGEQPKDVVVRVGSDLDGRVLAVQGPPGTGKTYAGAHLIRQLLDQGKKVGVTALSHAVIRHLLDEVGRPAWHKTGQGQEPQQQGAVRSVSDNAEVATGLAGGSVHLVGGTAWLWAREELAESVDVLVIDEAGQFSLANALAVAQAGRSVVLLGDPQQLTQPTQATHPYGSGVSVLDHLLGEHDTIPADRGVFLDRTYRMHPEICAFVSELMYDGRLESAADRERQRIDTPAGGLSGAGLRWVPVSHAGHGETSPAEAAVVSALVGGALNGSWTDEDEANRAMTPSDILVVAPYNAHVAALSASLPDGIRVGTVDRFQGQQAPLVIYSMGSSSAADAPRGVDFLYDLHRLNVAISRAKALTVVVGSPALLDAEVHTPAQLRAVNALCRYAELAETISVEGG